MGKNRPPHRRQPNKQGVLKIRASSLPAGLLGWVISSLSAAQPGVVHEMDAFLLHNSARS